VVVPPPRQPAPSPTNLVAPTGSTARAPVMMPVPRLPITNVVPTKFGNWTWFEDVQSSARGAGVGGTATFIRIVVGLVLAVVGAAVMA
jgi:hypothetical protein